MAKSQKVATTKSNRVTATKSRRVGNEPVVTLNYSFSTTPREMKHLLLCCGLLVKYHKYEFSISKGLHHLSEVFGPDSIDGKPEFYLSLFLLEGVSPFPSQTSFEMFCMTSM